MAVLIVKTEVGGLLSRSHGASAKTQRIGASRERRPAGKSGGSDVCRLTISISSPFPLRQFDAATPWAIFCCDNTLLRVIMLIPKENGYGPAPCDGDFRSRCRHGIVLRRGDQMRVGQPAVSKAIAQLEEWLGVRLLLRSTRSLTPTEAGMNFYVRAKRSIEEAEEAVLAARGAGAALSGKLRISASVCFGRLHIMRQLDRFLEKHPELEIDMVLDDRPINLVEEGIDVAFRSGSLANSTLVARKLGQARRLVMATPNYFAKHGEPQSSGRADRASDRHLHAGWRRRVVDVPSRFGRDVGGGRRGD